MQAQFLVLIALLVALLASVSEAQFFGYPLYVETTRQIDRLILST